MKKNICFISIFDLTIVFYEQAIRLSAHGHKCYWISTNPRWTKWLISKGVPVVNILELIFDKSEFLTEELRLSTVKEIVDAEATSDWTVNMALIADRFVMASNKSDINDYVCLYYYHIKHFFKDKAIDVVFGEPTNVNEIIANLVCQQLKIPFLYPQHMRIPSDRFFFEQGIASGIMVSSGSEASSNLGEKIIKDFRFKSKHPSYFHLNNHKKLSVTSFFYILRNRAKDLLSRKRSLTHHRLLDQIKIRFKSFINCFYLTYIYKYDSITHNSEKIAFFGLHVQPEASIDVMAPYFSDQLKLIKDVRRALPLDVCLLIKEHPNFLGKKNINFFKELKRIPNVRVVDPWTSTFDIYRHSNLVITVSGTTAYEAGILGIPAIAFSPMFFTGFSSVNYCPEITQLKSFAKTQMKHAKTNFLADIAFMNSLIEKSYSGYWSDPLSDPNVMSPSNLNALFVGFLDIVENVLEQETI
jgi:hypothetical protein